MTDTPIPPRILSWHAAMRVAAHKEGLTATFGDPPESMTFTLHDRDRERHLNLKINDGTLYLLPSPKIDLSIDRMVASCNTITQAHKAWAKENPE